MPPAFSLARYATLNPLLLDLSSIMTLWLTHPPLQVKAGNNMGSDGFAARAQVAGDNVNNNNNGDSSKQK